MKINYVPGLALRFYPGLSRELYDAVDTYVAMGCKIAIFTGTAPTEPEMWNLTNFNDYVTANTDKLVYQETTQLQFSYDPYKHKRVIQRYPVDSTAITPLIAPIAQDQAEIDLGAIKTDNSLYALIYCPDKDTTLNTVGNDLVLLVPNVGTGSTDFCSLSKINFVANESMYFRNLTISLFQGYQITDTLITEVQEDPENPGQNINVPVDSKKSVYINKTWGQRISEAYRDCFVSKGPTFKVRDYSNGAFYTPTALFGAYFNDAILSNTNWGYNILPKKYDTNTNTWLSTNLFAELDNTIYYGYLVNESMVNLLDEINSKSVLGQLTPQNDLINLNGGVSTKRFDYVNTTGAPISLANDANFPYKNLSDYGPGTLAKMTLASHSSQAFKDSMKQILIEEGFDEGLITSAIRSIVPINFDNASYSSAYDKDQNILTIQNAAPAKLKTRYKKVINNPTNEQMYIVLPRFLNRCAIEIPKVYSNQVSYTSISSVTYPATQKVIDGEVVDGSTQRIRQQDYTAISIGLTGNGNTDLEYDLLDVIDYVDSFTAMIKVPNKF